MKILKPGKVEMRKFVCEKCGCIFVANEYEHASLCLNDSVGCPTCYGRSAWEKGEPYEEPTQDDRKRLENLLENSPMGMEATTEYLLSHGVTFREG